MSKEKWTPEEGERYFWVGSDAMAIESEFNINDSCDYTRFQCGNYFRTIEEAQEAAEKFKELLLSLHEVKEEEKPNLPKLTAEVFDRTDCPDWAKFAALGGGGGLTFYEDKPMMSKDEYPKMWIKYDRWYPVKGTKFDASDWQNSLIERYAKLPEWVEVGGWVYDPKNGYGKITRGTVKSCYIEFDGGAGDFSPEEFAELKQARLRPYNSDEMKALVGKVIERGPSMHIVTGFENVLDNECMVHVNGYLYSANDLLRLFTIDNATCGVLEHLENGEWVE